MKTHLENRSGERRSEQTAAASLRAGQKVHLGWMLSEERRKGERRESERRSLERQQPAGTRLRRAARGASEFDHFAHARMLAGNRLHPRLEMRHRLAACERENTTRSCRP